MSEMHEFIVDTANKIFKKNVTKELIDASEKGEWSGELWDVLVESGLVSVGIEEILGEQAEMQQMHLLSCGSQVSMLLQFLFLKPLFQDGCWLTIK